MDSYWYEPPTELDLAELLELDHEVAVAITSHCFIDSMILFLLTRDGVPLDDASDWCFMKKLNECRDRRLISGDEARALRTLNGIRNLFAHSARAFMSDETIDEFFNSLPLALQQRVGELGYAGPDTFDTAFDGFRVYASVLLIHFRQLCDAQKP